MRSNSKTNGWEASRPVKLVDIAKLANVSIATVSRSLAGSDRVSNDTRDRVIFAAEKLGYRANRHAVSLRKQRSRVILVMIPDFANHNFAQLLIHMDRAAHRAGYEVMIAHTGDDTLQADSLADELFAGGIAGIILTSSYCPPRVRSLLLSGKQLPVVRTLSPTGRDERITSVQIDEIAAADEIVTHLVEQGHRRIAHLAGEKTQLVAMQREEGWRRSIDRAGLKDAGVIYRGFRVEDGRAAARELVEGEDLPDAVFIASDSAAFGFVSELRLLGVSVPDQIAVAGFDDVSFSELFTPPLTTVHLPRQAMAERAVDTLVAIIEGGEPEGYSFIPHRLVVRESSFRHG